MNRRSFLSMMCFVAPAVIAKPTYFFAPAGGWGVKLHSTIGQYADYSSVGDLALPLNLRLYNDPPVATIYDPCATGLPPIYIDYQAAFDPELRELGMRMGQRMAKTIDMIIEQQRNSTDWRM